MDVVLATDGSPSSGVAIRLVASQRWPAGTMIRVITALDTVRLAGPWATMTSYGLADLEQSLLEELEAVLADAAGQLAPTGARIERAVLLGRPSSAIIDQARSMGADLIVMGSRGQGPIRTMLLGSVSAEVVDEAPCPVLVARVPTISRVLLAHDGSDLALAAESMLVALPSIATVPVEVLSVVRTHEPGIESMVPTTLERALDSYRSEVEAARLRHEEIAAAAADRLRTAGIGATATVRAGDAARAIVDEAQAHGVDLVACGTHGRTGLERLVMGSVARNVLTHAHCSVLIVRARPATAPDQAAPG